MVFQEPAGGSSKAFSKMLARFKKTLDSERGAILFAVYRGKVSEGIDFADKLCRTVVNIGIPYPPLKDVKVILKREYNDLRAQPAADGSAQAERLVSGTEWYDTQAFRAFNQALGRCLRHKDDWGAIIILEARFANPRNAARLSKWIRSHICEYADFDDAIRDLCSFYAARIASDKAATASTKAATASTKRLATPPPAMPAAKLIRPEAVVFISDDDDFM
ncbi:hypothetical protein H4R19_005996 [Coemansia spiralis]|nr:hypothetical protein H4R19_005996 [Coemansia spiralis]